MTTGKKANDPTAVAISMRLNPRCNILGFHGWAGSLQISYYIYIYYIIYIYTCFVGSNHSHWLTCGTYLYKGFLLADNPQLQSFGWLGIPHQISSNIHSQLSI